MMSYRDTTFCASEVTEHTCGREFTEQDAINAEKWWGGKDYPVAYSEFCEEADNTQSGSDNDVTRKHSPTEVGADKIKDTQELDVIFDKMGYPKNTDFRKCAIRLITGWHNKQIETELEALREEVKHEPAKMWRNDESSLQKREIKQVGESTNDKDS